MASGMKKKYRSIKIHNHPLADADGSVLIHRAVLYEKIGPGPHRCHWCDIEVRWVVRHHGSRDGVLFVDHVDSDSLNNAPDNLVPSCHACNALREGGYRLLAGDLFVVYPNGQKKRAAEMSCEKCGIAFTGNTRGGRRKFCSRRCAARHGADLNLTLITHCPHGHEYTEGNTGLYRGSRRCRQCDREAHRSPESSPRVKDVPVVM